MGHQRLFFYFQQQLLDVNSSAFQTQTNDNCKESKYHIIYCFILLIDNVCTISINCHNNDTKCCCKE